MLRVSQVTIFVSDMTERSGPFTLKMRDSNEQINI